MSEFELLERQIDRLERQNRWLKRVGIVAATVIAVVFFVAAAEKQPNEVKANSLEIVTADGKSAIKVHAPNGCAQIDLWDTHSDRTTPQISIGCIAETHGGGAQIFMNGSKGQKAVNIVAQGKGNVTTW